MDKDRIRDLLRVLLHEIEEEEIGIRLFSAVYQNETELCFFPPQDRKRVIGILRTLSQDSRRHQQILERIAGVLGAGINTE